MTFKLIPVEWCPVCGGHGVKIGEYSGSEMDIGINFYECQVCKTRYHNPRMSEESMQEYYSSGEYRAYPEHKIDEEKAMLSTNQRMMMLDQYLKNIEMTPKRCLEMGCARGYLLRALNKKYGCEVVGYDLFDDPEAVVDVLTDRNDIQGKFDLICYIHVLEHIPQPMQELEWAVSKLNEDGVLMIELPMNGMCIIPHPVMFSRQVIPVIMKWLKAKYIYWDVQYNNVAFIFAQPG